jgi:DNA polymerase-3 subunit beta
MDGLHFVQTKTSRKDNTFMTTYAQTQLNTTVARTNEEADLKLTCKQEDLARGLSIVSRAVLAHSTVPILANIEMATDRGRLRLSATNLEIGIQCWIEAQISQEGTTALPADLLTRMVSSLPQGVMTLTLPAGSQTLNLTCAGSVSNIRGTDPREFPVIPGVEGEQGVSPHVIDAGLLKAMIGQVAFAAETATTFPVMTCVYAQFDRERLTFAAANTFRLAERIVPMPGNNSSPFSVLIPARNLLELARILPSQGAVQIVVTPQRNQIVFHSEQAEHVTFVSRLIEGTYRNYQLIIPKEHTTRAVVETRAFAAAIGRAALFARDEMKSVRLTLAEAEQGMLSGTLTVEADDADMGNHVSTMVAEVTGPSQQIIFNVKYLAEALDHIETPQVALELTRPGRPAVLKPMSEMVYTSIVMSMNTANKA